eukprot:scaffold53904_cov42-Attheya_sp.AAC.1
MGSRPAFLDPPEPRRERDAFFIKSAHEKMVTRQDNEQTSKERARERERRTLKFGGTKETSSYDVRNSKFGGCTMA